MNASKRTWLKFGGTAVVAGLLSMGCSKKGGDASPDGTGSNAEATGADKGEKKSIQNIGSDTMVNLAQAWAEAYSKVEPNVSVEVSGGGSGVGIAALINGTAEIANSSRVLEPEEKEKAKAKVGA